MDFIHWTESASDPYLFAVCDSLCYLIDGAPGCHFLHENHIKRVQWRCSFVLLETRLELEKRRNLVILIVAKVEDLIRLTHYVLCILCVAYVYNLFH